VRFKNLYTILNPCVRSVPPYKQFNAEDKSSKAARFYHPCQCDSHLFNCVVIVHVPLRGWSVGKWTFGVVFVGRENVVKNSTPVPDTLRYSGL